MICNYDGIYYKDSRDVGAINRLLHARDTRNMLLARMPVALLALSRHYLSIIYKYPDTIINSVMLIVRNKINKNVIHSDNKESLIFF